MANLVYDRTSGTYQKAGTNPVKQPNAEYSPYDPSTAKQGVDRSTWTINENRNIHQDYPLDEIPYPKGSQEYIDKLEELKGRIPSIFRGAGGTGGAENYLNNVPVVSDGGYSQEYKDFSGAVRQNMLNSLDPNASPFSQSELNAQNGDINRQFQQQQEQLRNKAASEGWLNTPQYVKAQRSLQFNNLIATQQNRVQYKQANANWNLQNRQVVNNFYNAYTNSEVQNRNIKLKTGKINADFAWDAAKAKARLAASAVAQARNARLRAFNMEHNILKEQISLSQYDDKQRQDAFWDRYNARMAEKAFDTGRELAEQEMQYQYLANKFKGLFG